MKYYYKFHLYINARHAVIIDEVSSPVHPHTWEIRLWLKVSKDDFINFTEFEERLEKYLQIYDGKLLNELEEMRDLNPTLENLGKILFKDIEKLLEDGKLMLTKMEISENPTRTYMIERD